MAHRLLIFSVCRVNILPISKQIAKLLIRCAIPASVLRTVAMFTPELLAETQRAATKMVNELDKLLNSL